MDRPPIAPLDGPGVKVSDPHELLLGYLDWYRETILRKISGLPDARLRAPVDPLGWSLLGVVKHLGWVERRWMRWGFAAEDVMPYLSADGFDPEFEVAPDEDVLAFFSEEVRRSRELASAASLTDMARVGGRFTTEADAPPLSRILFHLLQEYARHAGQVDVARELLDGTTGE